MKKDILFLDKDSTLGNWASEEGFYPGAVAFLQQQKERERELYIATTAGESGRVHLADADHLLTDYFGREKIDGGRRSLYCLPDGTFRVISDDYNDRIWTLPKKEQDQLLAEAEKLCDQKAATRSDAEREDYQRQIDGFWETWGQSIHLQTGEPFDETTRYKNPYLQQFGFSSHGKDLYLARRLISPLEYQNLRAVMVGDYGDAQNHSSDPFTPLVVVSKRVRAGEWNLVSTLVDLLFDNPEKMPWERFDELHTAKTVVIQNEPYRFERNEWDSRVAYCP